MAIRKNITVFRGGALVKVDLDEKGQIVGTEQAAAAPVTPAANRAPQKPAQAKDPARGPSKQEVMAQLKAAGIKFKATLGTAELIKLLPAQQPTEPTESAEVKATEGLGGTGDQDVI